jgi:hypothetical protein
MLLILKYQWFLHIFETKKRPNYNILERLKLLNTNELIMHDVVLKSRNSPYNSNNSFLLNVAINSSATNFTYICIQYRKITRLTFYSEDDS